MTTGPGVTGAMDSPCFDLRCARLICMHGSAVRPAAGRCSAVRTGVKCSAASLRLERSACRMNDLNTVRMLNGVITVAVEHDGGHGMTGFT